MVRKRRAHRCPLNRIFRIFGHGHIFLAVAVQQKPNETARNANVRNFANETPHNKLLMALQKCQCPQFC
jgi:hypothetical protein